MFEFIYRIYLGRAILLALTTAADGGIILNNTELTFMDFHSRIPSFF
jgi:hypothetical protein